MVKVFYPTRILTSTTGRELIDFVEECLQVREHTILVNMQDAPLMDSSGLGALATSARMTHQAGGTFAVCSVQGQARMLLELSNITSMFKVYPSPQEFADSLKKQPKNVPA